MTRIALIRHGATFWNAEGRIQGHADTPLSPEGRAELARLAPPPELHGGTWFSSPLTRAVETARLLGHEPEIEPRLIETNWGAWEGLTRAVTTPLSHRIAARGQAGLDFRPPGGESPRAAQDRLCRFFADLERNGPDFAVCVTHKGIIRAALSLALGWDMRDKPPFKLKWRAAHIFVWESGHLRLETANLALPARA